MILDVSFESGYFRGKQEKHVYIRTDEPNQYTYFLYADVVMPYELEPFMLRISELEKPTTHEVVLTDNTRSGEHRLLSVSGMTDGLSGEIDKTGRMQIHVDPQRFAKGDALLQLEISGVEEPVTYRVHLVRETEFRVSPRNLLLMGIPSGRQTTRQLRIEDLPEGTQLLSCESSIDFLACGKSEMVDTDLVISFHTIPDRMIRGYGKGTVTVELELGDGHHQTITVPAAYNIN